MKCRFLHIVFALLLCVPCVAQIDDIQYDYFRARYYLEHGETDSAIMLWKIHSDKAEFSICLVDCLIDAERYPEAIEACRHLEKTNSAEADFRMARIYSGMGFAEETIDYLEKHFNSNDKKSYSEILKCKEFENINRTAEWRDFWSVQRYSRTAEVFADIEYMISSGEYENAISQIGEMSAGNAARKNFLLSKAYFGLENYSQALKYVELSLEKSPNDAKCVALKFAIQKVSGDMRGACETGRKMLAADRYNAGNMLEYAEVCSLCGKNSEAKIYTSKYLQCFPDDERALFLDARLALATEYSFDALVELSTLIERNPSKSEYYRMRGETYYGFEMWEQAFYDFSMALDIMPDDARLNYMMGMCKYNLASYEKACYYWRRAATSKSREAAEMFYQYCE